MFRLFFWISLVHCLKPSVTLYSSNGCRACLQFEKKFNNLKNDYDEMMVFEKINISESGENKKMARSDSVKKIPLVVFKVDDKEVNRFTGVKSKYDDIDETCKYLTKVPVTKDNLFDPVVLQCAELCEKVYDDNFLKSSKQYIENEQTDCQASITIDGTTVFVTFRGSDSHRDWILNFKKNLVNYPSNSDKKVHAGFLIQWLSVKDELLKKLSVILDSDRYLQDVVFSGHSAGVVCCLAASDFSNSTNRKVSCEVVTFGAPRMCNKSYMDYFESRIKCTRIVLDRDLITRLPFIGYRHVGNPWQIRDKEVMNRETTTMETLWWMFLGIKDADIGIRDHLIQNYVQAIRKQCCKSA